MKLTDLPKKTKEQEISDKFEAFVFNAYMIIMLIFIFVLFAGIPISIIWIIIHFVTKWW